MNSLQERVEKVTKAKLYVREIDYILNVLVVVLGKERFGAFAEFIDNDDHLFSELVAAKDSRVNPENYECSRCDLES